MTEGVTRIAAQYSTIT